MTALFVSSVEKRLGLSSMPEGLGWPLCLIGAGGHGLGIASQIARRTGSWPVFSDSGRPVQSSVGESVVKYSALEDIEGHSVLVTIGRNDVRAAVQTRAEKLGLPVTNFISDPERYFGELPAVGAVVLSGAVVNADSLLGPGVIVNNGAIVEHGCKLGAFCHISPGAVLAGDVHIGRETWIGANATVLQGVTICHGVTVGAGSVVTRDITEPGVYVGQPAKHLAQEKKGT